jgi:hypothetical protein
VETAKDQVVEPADCAGPAVEREFQTHDPIKKENLREEEWYQQVD